MKQLNKLFSAGTLILFTIISQPAWAQDPASNFLIRLGTYMRQLAAPAGIVALIFGVVSVWLAVEQKSYTIVFKICVGVAIIASAPSLIRFFVQLGM
ncbi:MAG: TrbC/VirB2 family protein [Deltaproteobacteria bacterium]|nr:TrbC/VirB2 family protein [Deltaproteobacteria bacterium]